MAPLSGVVAVEIVIGGVGLVLLIAAVFGIRSPKVYEDLRIPLDTRRNRALAGLLGAAFVAIGLGWIRPPSPDTSNTAARETALGATAAPSIAASIAASLTAASGSAASSAPATPTQTPPPAISVTRRTLHWTNAATGGAVLDGGVYTPHKAVWMEELFPGAAPSEFTVVENVDPALPADVKNALRMLAPSPFGVVAADRQARSSEAWLLPDPIAGIGYRSFTFRDANPEGRPVASSTIVSGLAAVRVQSGSGGCLAQSGGAFTTTTGDSCIQLSVQAPADPTFAPSLMVPWGSGSEDLVGSLQASFGSLAETLAKERPGAPFDPAKAMDTFEQQNAALLPAGSPDGWDLGMEGSVGDGIVVGPGKPATVTLSIHAPTPGRTFIALRLADRANPSSVVISQLIPLVVTEPGAASGATESAVPTGSPPPSETPAASASPSGAPGASPSNTGSGATEVEPAAITTRRTGLPPG